MNRRCHNFRRGSVVVGDWVFIATLLVLGAITGLIIRPALVEPDDANRPTAVNTQPVLSPDR